ncbi:MAG: transposase [Candidatus Zambryskibacteria bacterium]|nr:transposase [Candidatus Zambryskibacteria bacterium]
MRKVALVENEFYHIYNRGVDKRAIFSDKYDLQRFFQSIFNTIKPIGSIFEKSFNKNRKRLLDSPLVQFIAYCLNPNHFHFILTQLEERGIEKFMHRLGTGYTMYFNEKYMRNGALFQGRFKANHINSNEYLLHASAYVNLNNKVHKYGDGALMKSSWKEYTDAKGDFGFCNKDLTLGQFKNRKDYETFAMESLEDMVRRKEILKELENNHLEVEPPSGRKRV